MFVIYKLYPMIYGFAVSFLDRNSTKKLSSIDFVWFKNYINVLTSKTFWETLGRSFYFAAVYTVFVMFFGFLFGVLFNNEFKGRKIVRTMFYMPYVTNIIAIATITEDLWLFADCSLALRLCSSAMLCSSATEAAIELSIDSFSAASLASRSCSS